MQRIVTGYFALLFGAWACCSAAGRGGERPKEPVEKKPAESAKAQHSLRAMTFNIRYNNRADGKDAWPNRREMVAETVRGHRADVAGLQEAQKDQIDDLVRLLPDYAWIGVGRDDGKQRGEAVPIFYRKDRLDKIESGHFWLSLDPEKPGSKSWDAAITRMATWAKFKDRQSGKSFLLVNTHLDHVGRKARLESAKLLFDRVPKIAGSLPAVLTGDFNCTPESDPVRALTAAGDGKSDKAPRLVDTLVRSAAKPEGPDSTWNGFRRVVPGNRIDYIFVTPRVRVAAHRTLVETKDGRFPSDHLPVLADLSLP